MADDGEFSHLGLVGASLISNRPVFLRKWLNPGENAKLPPWQVVGRIPDRNFAASQRALSSSYGYPPCAEPRAPHELPRYPRFSWSHCSLASVRYRSRPASSRIGRNSSFEPGGSGCLNSSCHSKPFFSASFLASLSTAASLISTIAFVPMLFRVVRLGERHEFFRKTPYAALTPRPTWWPSPASTGWPAAPTRHLAFDWPKFFCLLLRRGRWHNPSDARGEEHRANGVSSPQLVPSAPASSAGL